MLHIVFGCSLLLLNDFKDNHSSPVQVLNEFSLGKDGTWSDHTSAGGVIRQKGRVSPIKEAESGGLHLAYMQYMSANCI